MDDLPPEYLNLLLKGFSFLDFCNLYMKDDKKSSFRRNFRFIYKVPCLTVYFVSLTLYFTFFNGNMAFDSLARSASVYMICIQTIYRSFVVVYKNEEIKALIVRLGRIWRSTDLSEEQVITKNMLMKSLNLRFKVFDWMANFGSWEYMLGPLFDIIFRQLFLQQGELLLPFNCFFPFDPTKTWFRYLAVYLFQVYSMIHIVYCYIGTETILIVITSHLSTEFTLLQDDLLNVARDTNNVSGNRNMRNLIRKHQELIRLAQDLDDIFNGIVFMNLCCSTIMICFFGVSMIIAKGAFATVKECIIVFAGIYPIYNVCFNAELLKEASQGIGDALYQSFWYNLSREDLWAACFIIKRSHKPCYLTSMKYNKIALSTFMTVMKTSWSCFSLASNMNENK